MASDAHAVGSHHSSSSAGKGTKQYDVFISFRGVDTRRNFTNNLYNDLQCKGLKCFIDNEDLERGEAIKPSLVQAIEESSSAIVVLCKNYASSTWCLDELVKILDSKENLGLLHVFPVFYEVNPSDVRQQTGSFEEAFRKHERRFADDKMKVQRWRNALKEVAGFAGWNSEVYRYDKDLIERIFKDVSSKLDSNNKERAKGYMLPTIDLEGDRFQRDAERIVEWIMKDKVSTIGIWGMVGAGKTTLAKHVHNKLLAETGDDFDHIIWLTVSQYDKSIYKLQKAIARSINLDISDEDDIKRRSGKLLRASKQINRCLLFLDDVCDPTLLEDVSFPVSNDGIQLIMTTHSWEVCKSMNCMKNMIKVKPLYDKESWGLFNRTLGIDQVKRIAKEVVKQCEGLPLAIVKIAKSMKGKQHLTEWNHLLECLRNKNDLQDLMDEGGFAALKSSYDRLKDDKLRRFFLVHCIKCPWRGVHHEDLERFTRRFWYVEKGWEDETKSLEMPYNEGYSMLHKLTNNSLLLHEPEHWSFWKIHPLLRVLAINIVKKDDEIMAKSCMNLKELPNNGKWKENLHKVFLTDNKIWGILDGTSPKCSKLSTLLLDHNYYVKIPDDFFSNMPALETLDLSRTNIIYLPISLSNLECLVALLLSKCQYLICVPSLEKMQRLLELDLSYTGITEAPHGLELLLNLRCLNLEGTEHLKMSSSTISKMTNLQSLRLMNVIPKSIDMRGQDLQDLRRLKVIFVNFGDIEEFNAFVKSLLEEDRQIRSYYLRLCFMSFDAFDPYDAAREAYLVKRVGLRGIDLANTGVALPKDMNHLVIEECELKDLKQIVTPGTSLRNLRDLRIEGCKGMKNVMRVELLGDQFFMSIMSSGPITCCHMYYFTHYHLKIIKMTTCDWPTRHNRPNRLDLSYFHYLF